STVWAQGGIAAALDPSDSPEAHRADTLAAGGGLSDPEAVRVLVTEGPARVRELVARGAVFDKAPDGDIALTREGGHHADRIAHAGGDATGAEISRALVAQIEAVRHDPGIEVVENALVLDVLTTADGRACGVTRHVRGAGSRDGVGAVLAPAVILATGGIGQVFRSSTNPAGATGDGIAAALRAGAVLGDLEFVQFHPTVLWLGSGAKGQVPLVSEAVRGEGALLLDVDGHRFMPGVHEMAELAPRDVVGRAIVRRMAACGAGHGLRDVDGRRFMPGVHEMAELAPRDVVAHAIVRRMAATGADNVLLDARHLGRDFLRTRFPTIDARLLEAGIDWSEEPVPVAPAQHYHSGGVVTDLDGRSTVDGLYAVGEVAGTGVHGANRLASNSLLEGLVFAARAAQDVVARFDTGELRQGDPVERPGGSGLVAAAARSRVQKVTSAGPGVIRSARSLAEADERLAAIRTDAHRAAEVVAEPQAAEWETTNVHLVARALTRAAWLREETRGGHYRTDFPHPDETWRRRIEVHLDPEGTLHTR